MGPLDRQLRAWHVWGLNFLAGGWFVVLVMAGTRSMPGVATGQCPIGLCLTGYEPDVARSFLKDLGSAGRTSLKQLISAYDFVLPVLLVMGLAATLIYYTRPASLGGHTPLSLGWRLALIGVPILYGAADYGENIAVLRMLGEAEPDRISDALAHRASLLTAAKSQLVVTAIAFAGAIVAAYWMEWRKSQR